jgi:hypothetical protein
MRGVVLKLRRYLRYRAKLDVREKLVRQRPEHHTCKAVLDKVSGLRMTWCPNDFARCVPSIFHLPSLIHESHLTRMVGINLEDRSTWPDEIASHTVKLHAVHPTLSYVYWTW